MVADWFGVVSLGFICFGWVLLSVVTGCLWFRVGLDVLMSWCLLFGLFECFCVLMFGFCCGLQFNSSLLTWFSIA